MISYTKIDLVNPTARDGREAIRRLAEMQSRTKSPNDRDALQLAMSQLAAWCVDKENGQEERD